MKWSNEAKEKLSYIFAAASLLVGFGLTIAGFIVIPTGIIDNSVLWVLGQCLTFTGAVCGVALHVKNSTNQMKEEIINDLSKK